MDETRYLIELPNGRLVSLTMDQINRLKEQNPNWPETEEPRRPEPERRGNCLNPNTSVKKKKRLKKK